MTPEPETQITEIKFTKHLRRIGSHVGFVSFVYSNKTTEHSFFFDGVAVHERYHPKDNLRYYLKYPLDKNLLALYHPLNRPTQFFIEKIINQFLENMTQKKEEVCHDRT